METEMIERVAAALEFLLLSEGKTLRGEDATLVARVAIEAMREPTREMRGAGLAEINRQVARRYDQYDPGRHYTDPSDGALVWSAMMGEALGEPIQGSADGKHHAALCLST